MSAHLSSTYSRAAVLVVTLAVVLAPVVKLCTAQDGLWTAVSPAPSGPYRVGTVWMSLVDSKRNDPFLRNGSKRELLVRFWYPAVVARECAPAEYSSRDVWTYESQLVGMLLPRVRTNSCLRAHPVSGVHPVVVASHGYTGTLTDYTFIFEELASRGYVVASVAHTYETTAVAFPDGRLAKSVLGSHLTADSLRTDDQSLSFARAVRLQDLRFVLRELEQLNSISNFPLAGRLDLSRIGIMGHSLGGEVAIASMEQEADFKAGVILDGEISAASVRGTDKPVLILAEGRGQWTETECRLWSNLSGPRMAVNFRGAGHLTPSDAVWLAPYLPGISVETGSMGVQTTVVALRNYIVAFFDAYLANRPQSALLNGASASYRDAAVTTRSQSLCAQPQTSSAHLAR